MRSVTIQAVNNGGKMFTVAYRPRMPLHQLVNEGCSDPKKEGIPILCNKGVCRSCTVKVVDNAELLQQPSKQEQRALAVGRTAYTLGHRLACMCYFEDLPPYEAE